MKWLRTYAIVTATAPMIWASAAFAQPTPASGQESEPPESGQSRAASDIESGAAWFGYGNSILSLGVDCGRMASIEKRLLAEANAYQRLGNGFSKFGDVLTMTTAIAQAAQGNYGEAAKSVGNAAFDKALCAVYGPVACAAWASWNAGTAVGNFIRDIPGSGGRTIGNAVDDQWLSWLGPYLDQPLNVESMQAAFAEFQRRQTDLKRRQREASEYGGQCKAKEEAEKRKTAIDELLKQAKPPAVRSSSDAEAENLFGQSAAEASNPYAAQRLADEQNRKLSEADQLMRDSNSRAQAASAAIMQQGLNSLATANSPPAPSPRPMPTLSGASRAPAVPVPPSPQPSQPSCSNAALPEGQVCTGN